MIGPIPYVGGKSRLIRQILAILPEHSTYVEPFAGGAQIFFRKRPSKVEVLNDIYLDLITFYRVCQHHYEELLRYLRFILISRAWYGLLQKQNPETLTDIQRAARFFVLQKESFGGLVVKQHYHYGVVQRPNFNPERIRHIIEAAHQRLQHVQIECLPYEEILNRFDRPSTLFYIDPPYWGPTLYKQNFGPSDFDALAQRLGKISGKFVLSLNDRPEVWKAFAAFTIEKVQVAYSAQRASGRRYAELLVRNSG